VVTAVGTVAVGSLIAVHLNRTSVYTRVVKTVVFLPVILPVVFTGQVWVFGLDGNFGWINSLLESVHTGLGQSWLSNPHLVMWTIEFVTVLQFSGLPMIIVLAALQDISPDIQEAASLDGVSPFQRLRLITLPLTKEVLLTVLLLQLMSGFKVFDQVFVMARNSPAAQVASTYVYRNAFQLQHFGLGAAGAVVTCLVVVAVSMAYLSVFRPERISRG
jgi:ABC-type sugar transport system permease subunit